MRDFTEVVSNDRPHQNLQSEIMFLLFINNFLSVLYVMRDLSNSNVLFACVSGNVNES